AGEVPLGVKPYRPASRLPKGRTDPDVHTTPDLAWQLREAARAAGIPFRLLVADSVYGENLTLEGRLDPAQIPYLMGLKPSQCTWQEVEDPAHPPSPRPRRRSVCPSTLGSAPCASTAMATNWCTPSPRSSGDPAMGPPRPRA